MKSVAILFNTKSQRRITEYHIRGQDVARVRIADGTVHQRAVTVCALYDCHTHMAVPISAGVSKTSSKLETQLDD